MFSWFERQILPFEDHRVERPPSNTLGFYLYFLRPLRWVLLLTLAVSFVAAATEMALFVFVGQLVDMMAQGNRETFFQDNLTTLIVMSAVVLVARPVLAIAARGFVNLTLAPGMTSLVRWRTYRYVLRQSLAFFHDDFAGRIAQKVMQTGMAVRESVINVVDGVWFLLIYFVGTIWLFAALDWRLVLPMLLWLLGYVATVVFLVPAVRKRSSEVAETNSMLTGRIVDSYTNIQAVKLFSSTQREDAFTLDGFRAQYQAMTRLMRWIVTMTATLLGLNSAMIFAVGFLALWLWSVNDISIGAVAMAGGLVIRLNQMSGWILRTITSLFESIGTVQNGIQTLAKSMSVTDRPGAVPLDVSHGELRFVNVGFHYGKDGGIIDDLSLTIQPGEKVGIVGRSGAGKSTLVNLLLRFYDVESGQILIDEQDVSTVTQESLRDAIGVVTQDTSLLHRSVLDNLLYGRPEADMEEVEEAIQRAHADGFIPDLRDRSGASGLDALVGERGVKLSGGQRQRIAIARVLLKDAPILILDEATSALDSEVEAAIQQQLDELMSGKTVMAIAHRLSTIAAMDRLVVMDQGRIIEEGSHAVLLKADGLYAQLWKRQSGGFLAQTIAA